MTAAEPQQSVVGRGAPVAAPPTLYRAGGIPALPAITAPVVRIAMPDGTQQQLPGELWPEPDIWEASARRARMDRSPVEIRLLTRKESNRLVEQWHPLGAETRPFGYAAFGLFAFGKPVAVATSGTTVSASVDKGLGLHRKNVIELTRLCRAPEHPGCLRIMLRAWRDYLATTYWPYFPVVAKDALVTYSMPGKSGNSMRTDGWTRVRSCQPWAGGATWSRPSRADQIPGRKALWVYWLRAAPTAV